MKTLTLLSILSLLAACGVPESEPQTVDEEGCEHLQRGPAVTLIAGTVRDESAPAVGNDHKRYDLALFSKDDNFLRFAASEATDYVFFFDADIYVEFVDSSGAVVIPEETATSSPACSEVKARFTVPLAVGTYYLVFQGTATDLSLVIEEAEHEDHE